MTGVTTIISCFGKSGIIKQDLSQLDFCQSNGVIVISAAA
jgi:hypothetical protein